MNRYRIVMTIGALLLDAAPSWPQPPAPPPPARPAPPALLDELDEARVQLEALPQIDVDGIRESVRAQVEALGMQRHDLEAVRETARITAEGAREWARAGRLGDIFGGMAGGVMAPLGIGPQLLGKGRHDGDDRAYERGQRALDGRDWDEALEMFNQVAAGGGSRADGALYWKAYALAKLGRRDDAMAAIAQLRKSYATSRWLDDAKALELEVKQASGQKVSPEAENDEDLKLMALNGLVQSDPERALPLLENLLKTSSSPKLKERVVFVLAESSAPRAKQLLEQVARGGAGNPDLQVKAIRYISATSKKTDNRPLLWEIYSSSNDNQVKRAILRGLMASRDKDHLLQIAKTEKSTPLRLEAISFLGSTGAQSDLWQIYQSETTPEVKQQILHSMVAGGSADRVMEIAKTEKDPKLRRSAIQALGSMSASKSGDALVSMYGTETDPTAKRWILDALHSDRNAKSLVEMARKENDPAMKREIVSRLSHMKSKEAADYMMELLK